MKKMEENVDFRKTRTASRRAVLECILIDITKYAYRASQSALEMKMTALAENNTLNLAYSQATLDIVQDLQHLLAGNKLLTDIEAAPKPEPGMEVV